VVLNCYTCKLPFTPTGWNPARLTAICPQSCCGRHLHVGEVAERAYGPHVGKQVKDLLAGLQRVCAKSRRDTDLTDLVDLTAKRLEAIFKAAEAEADTMNVRPDVHAGRGARLPVHRTGPKQLRVIPAPPVIDICSAKLLRTWRVRHVPR
jgi:hypothetical protein